MKIVIDVKEKFKRLNFVINFLYSLYFYPSSNGKLPLSEI